MVKLRVLNIEGSLYRENCGWCVKRENGYAKFCPCLVSISGKDTVYCDKVREIKNGFS